MKSHRYHFVVAITMLTQTSLYSMELYKQLQFLKKPSTVFSASLISLGIYSYFNSTARSDAYHWIKDSVRSIPPLISITTGIIGSWWLYYSYTNQKNELGMPIDSSEIKNYIQRFAFRLANIESILKINILDKKNPQKDRLDMIENQLSNIEKTLEAEKEQQRLMVEQLWELKETTQSLKK